MPKDYIAGMTTFIPEWTRVSGRDLHIKRVLNTLDDTCLVRRPINPAGWTPNFFLQYPGCGWLCIAVSDAPFSVLDPRQLFESDDRVVFEQVLAQFSELDGITESTSCKLEKLILMWFCSSEETRTLSAQYLSRFGVRLLSKEQFMQIGSKLIPRLLAPVDEEGTQSLLGHFFPEAEIPAVCTTRRNFHRDNSAKLTRFFLDCEQEWATKLDLEPLREQMEAVKDFSVRLINGVAGSGKTLIALNRALLLAKMFPERRVLVLIHNTPIVADIKDRLHRAHCAIPENLEITTFYAWVFQQWKRVFQAPPRMPQNSAQVSDLIKHYRAKWAELKQTDAQLFDELDFINQYLVVNEQHYLEINRAGQGFSLRSKERSQIWALYEAVTSTLAQEGVSMWSALPRDICLADACQQLEKYQHILVDEAQFFAPSWFQVVKLATESDGDMFLCADPNQGFMKSRLSWKSVGLDVTGRTKKLRKSYRTTQAILKAASYVLSQFTLGDPEDFLEPDFAGMEPGVLPILFYVASPQDAVDRVVNEVAAMADEGQLQLSSLLVIYGDKVNKSMLVQEIGKRLGQNKIWWLNKKEHKKTPPNGYGQDYLRVVNIDSATGLEANVVFLVGIENLLSDECLPNAGADEQAIKTEERARKLYMAMTRAGQGLVVVSSQKVLAGIEGVFELQM